MYCIQEYILLHIVPLIFFLVGQFCLNGIHMSLSGGDYCCPKSCGNCGGTGCNHRPGGGACCLGDKIEKAKICSNGLETGCVFNCMYIHIGAKLGGSGGSAAPAVFLVS